MSNEPLHVLLIEDSEDDARLVIRELKRGNFTPDWQRVQSEAILRTQLKTAAWDVVIADYRVPELEAPLALKIFQQSQLDIPFIVVSGAIGEKVAVEMMKAGAHDYLMKDDLTRLPEAVRRELREAKVRQQHRNAEILIRRQLAAMEAAIDGIAILQADHHLYMNHSYLKLFGYDQLDELTGQSWKCLYPSKMVDRFENEIFPKLESALSWQGEAIATRKDGTTFVLELSYTLAGGGELVAVCRDITERKQSEKKLKQLNADLMRSNQELEQFAYVASHDLQEPLRKIRNFAELLAQNYQGQMDERADRYISYVTEGATRMQALISDLLSFSCVGRAVLNLKSTSLEMIVQQMTSDLETVIRTRNAVISFENLPTVLADPTRMRQLLQNLISNAIKYCQADVPTVHIRATHDNHTWIISVQDNGIGIDPQYADRIFVIFQRLHHQKDYSGTGIGLAICKKIVELHGGQIWVDSQEGQGSTFSFTLPDSYTITSASQASS